MQTMCFVWDFYALFFAFLSSIDDIFICIFQHVQKGGKFCSMIAQHETTCFQNPIFIAMTADAISGERRDLPKITIAFEKKSMTQGRGTVIIDLK